MTFIEWLQIMGCEVECVQEDDGSGYAVYEVRPSPIQSHFPVTKVTVGTHG
jgi:hypothetical protein